jgi:Putative transposase
VGFRDQDSQDPRWKTMTLPAHEFIRRCLQHVVPQGFHKVRDYGRWSPRHRPLLPQLPLWLAGHSLSSPPESTERESPPPISVSPPRQAGQPCPHGGQGLLLGIRLLPRLRRGPPCATALPLGPLLPASSPPRRPKAGAPCHPAVFFPRPVTRRPRPPRSGGPGSDPAPWPSRSCLPPRSLRPPPTPPRQRFSSGAGWMKIPSRTAPPFRSTAVLWRRRATKPLIRSAQVPPEWKGGMPRLTQQ